MDFQQTSEEHEAALRAAWAKMKAEDALRVEALARSYEESGDDTFLAWRVELGDEGASLDAEDGYAPEVLDEVGAVGEVLDEWFDLGWYGVGSQARVTMVEISGRAFAAELRASYARREAREAADGDDEEFSEVMEG